MPRSVAKETLQPPEGPQALNLLVWDERENFQPSTPHPNPKLSALYPKL